MAFFPLNPCDRATGVDVQVGFLRRCANVDLCVKEITECMSNRISYSVWETSGSDELVDMVARR